jgi:hypothetical protein
LFRPVKVKDDKESGRPPLTWPQVAGLFAVVVTLVIIVDFSQRLASSQRLVDEAGRAGTAVALLETERSALQTQVAYATTDAAVIEWAHESGRMVRPGEVLVVPVIPTAVATPLPAPIVLPTPPPNYVLWWEMFFSARAGLP